MLRMLDARVQRFAGDVMQAGAGLRFYSLVVFPWVTGKRTSENERNTVLGQVTP